MRLSPIFSILNVTHIGFPWWSNYTLQKQINRKTSKQKSVIGGVSIMEEMSFLFILEICFHCNTPKQDGFGVGFSPEKYISEMFI